MHARTYRADIDGLRGLAVLFVLFFHAGLGCPGGYVGVDVFFVLSGYLITPLILEEIEAGTFRLASFWERRIRRILPALCLVMLGTLGLGWFLLLPTEFRDLGRSLVAQAGMASNVYFWLTSGYFDAAAESRPLLHLWSLAVEEQFYVLLPLALLVLSRFGRIGTAAGLVAMLGISFALNLMGVGRYPSATYFLLSTRAWELLVGSLVCLLPAPKAKWRGFAEGTAAIGLGGIIAAAFLFDRTTAFPGAAALLPCLGTAAVLWAGSRRGPEGGERGAGEIGDSGDGRATWIGRALAGPWLRPVGLISYSLYLWHWPLLVLARQWGFRELTVAERVACLMASVVLAWGSWILVERPIRSRRLMPDRRMVLAAGGACMAMFLLAGGLLAISDGLLWRFPDRTQRYLEVTRNRMRYFQVTPEDVLNERLVEVGGDPNGPVHCLVWGDSHAAALFPALKDRADRTGMRCVSATYPSTTPLLGFTSLGPASLKDRSVPFNDAVVTYAGQRRVPHVLIVAYWGKTSFAEGPVGGLSRMQDCFAETVARLRRGGSRVWIMKQVPAYPIEIPQALARLSVLGRDPDALRMPLQHHREQQAPYDRIIDAMTAHGATVLDPATWLSDETQRTVVEAEGRVLYRDAHHLTPEGAMQLSPLFETIFPTRAAEESTSSTTLRR